jgi:FkbM family methyltransferase
MLKDFVAGVAERLGYKIIPLWRLESFAAVEDLRRRLDFLKVDLVLDVGANAGQFRDMLRGPVGYRGRIVSFEPVPELAEGLAARAAGDKLWRVHHLALGAAAGEASFNVMEHSQFSSFLQPTSADVAIFSDTNKVARQVTVRVGTLDDVLPELLREAPAARIFLKLDTQGFDLEVLKGAEGVLGGIAAVQIEASVRRIYEGAPAYQQVISYLEERGFVMSAIVPNNAGQFPLLVEFDCQLIRADLASEPKSQ